MLGFLIRYRPSLLPDLDTTPRGIYSKLSEPVAGASFTPDPDNSSHQYQHTSSQPCPHRYVESLHVGQVAESQRTDGPQHLPSPVSCVNWKVQSATAHTTRSSYRKAVSAGIPVAMKSIVARSRQIIDDNTAPIVMGPSGTAVTVGAAPQERACPADADPTHSVVCGGAGSDVSDSPPRSGGHGYFQK